MWPNWFSGSLIKILKETNRIHNKFQKFGNPRVFDTYSMLRTVAKSVLIDCFRSSIGNVETNSPKITLKSFEVSFNNLPKQM